MCMTDSVKKAVEVSASNLGCEPLWLKDDKAPDFKADAMGDAGPSYDFIARSLWSYVQLGWGSTANG